MQTSGEEKFQQILLKNDQKSYLQFDVPNHQTLMIGGQFLLKKPCIYKKVKKE